MRLYELAYCCRLYQQLTDYDVSLERVHDVAADGVNLELPEHRDVVLRWLREWGCRQFAHQYHELSSGSLREWGAEWVGQLPEPAVHLVDLTDQEIETAEKAYEDLRGRPASYSHRGSARHLKTVGPVGAAKTLYILRPNIFPPWDRGIMQGLGYGEHGREYGRYLRDVAAQLHEVSRDSGIPVLELPKTVDRPESSPAKLIDEYNWVAITNGCKPPSPDELRTWSEWAR